MWSTVAVVLLVLVHTVSTWNEFCRLRCKNREYKHTVCEFQPCPPNPHCGVNYVMKKFSDAERHEIVRLHNKYRNTVAEGGLSDKGIGPAANMQIISYSKELEFVAQCWANNCNTGGARDMCHSTEQYRCVGQTVHSMASRWNFTEMRSVDYFIKDWYEVHSAITDTSILDSFRPPNIIVIDGFTQMVWAQTKYVGCGRTIYGKNTNDNNLLVVCNYAPCGNKEDQPVFIKGKGCSKCGSERCNSEFTSLCGKIRHLKDDKWKEPFELSAVSNKASEIILMFCFLIGMLY